MDCNNEKLDNLGLGCSDAEQHTYDQLDKFTGVADAHTLTETPPCQAFSNAPTEAEVRQHFGKLLKDTDVIMRPPYTTIWALEDGTLLWDWKSGFADLGPVLKNIILLIGGSSTQRSEIAQLFNNADVIDFEKIAGCTRVSQVFDLIDNIEGAKNIVIPMSGSWPDLNARLIIFCKNNSVGYRRMNIY